MTVAELMLLLSRCPPDMPVVVDGYESGYDDPHVMTEKVAFRRVPREPSLCGQHDMGDFYHEDDEVYHPPVDAVLISRYPQ